MPSKAGVSWPLGSWSKISSSVRPATLEKSHLLGWRSRERGSITLVIPIAPRVGSANAVARGRRASSGKRGDVFPDDPDVDGLCAVLSQRGCDTGPLEGAVRPRNPAFQVHKTHRNSVARYLRLRTNAQSRSTHLAHPLKRFASVGESVRVGKRFGKVRSNLANVEWRPLTRRLGSCCPLRVGLRGHARRRQFVLMRHLADAVAYLRGEQFWPDVFTACRRAWVSEMETL